MIRPDKSRDQVPLIWLTNLMNQSDMSISLILHRVALLEYWAHEWHRLTCWSLGNYHKKQLQQIISIGMSTDSSFFEICLKLFKTLWLSFSLFLLSKCCLFYSTCRRNFHETIKHLELTWQTFCTDDSALISQFKPPSLLSLKSQRENFL